jgi:hypothetical protein
MVEPQPSKLMARVRFPLPAPFILSMLGEMLEVFALVAQLVEHTLGKGEVSSSNLLKSSIFCCGGQPLRLFLSVLN